MNLERYRTDVVAFIDEQVTRTELGRPFRLFEHERAILRTFFAFNAEGRLPYDTCIYSAIKKTGKTCMNGVVNTWWGFTQEAPNEVKVCANDLEQSQARVFRTVSGLLKHNDNLGQSVVNETSRVIELSNGTRIEAIATDYTGEAGANQGLSSWDELWGYTSERARRLWEELTPVPTRRNSIRFISTYAGFEGESDLLWQLYLQAVGPEEHPEGRGVRVHPSLPIYANPEARIIAYWDHEPRMPWQTPAYLAAQKQTLRANSYQRLHENRWATGTSTFITPELWDPNVDLTHRPVVGTPPSDLFLAVDAATKHDNAAVVGVYAKGQQLALGVHRIWKPTPTDPLDIEQTIETFLRELHARGNVAEIVCDPYQLHRSITTLRAAGLPIREYPQTSGNLTAAGQTLFELLQGRNLRLYPAPDLRHQALQTVAVESSRGWRIAKEKASHKIDAIVALAMACRAATDQSSTSGGGMFDAFTGRPIDELPSAIAALW